MKLSTIVCHLLGTLTVAVTRAVALDPGSSATETAGTEPSCPTEATEWPAVVPPPHAKKARNIGIILYRSFTMLDVFGPLNALQSVARIYPLNLYLLSHNLEPVSTEPFTKELNLPNSNFWFQTIPTHTFANPPDLDVLLVPGGWGWEEPDLQEHVDYITRVYPSLEYLITVCVGSVIAARGGILDGRNATTNKSVWKTTKDYPAVNWAPKARWVVDGNIWTTSGVAAGIDGTLAWINHVYGTENATNIAKGMEYEPHKNAFWDPFSDYFNTTASINRLEIVLGLK